jgi:hypothetical protein
MIDVEVNSPEAPEQRKKKAGWELWLKRTSSARWDAILSENQNDG